MAGHSAAMATAGERPECAGGRESGMCLRMTAIAATRVFIAPDRRTPMGGK